MKRAIAITAVLLTGACTMIDTQRAAPDDWPRLALYEHHVPVGELWRQCYPAMGLWAKLILATPEGCYKLSFDRMRCDMYFFKGYEDSRVTQHEQEHCAGMDHPGDSTLHNAWTKWKTAHPDYKLAQ